MAGQDAQLDAHRVRALFHELSQRLADRGVQAQLFVVGGAAMALAYDQHRSTRDVDALFFPAPAVRAAAEEIGAVHGLEPDWLNDAAKGFLPGPDEHPHTVFESESLLVQVPSAEYLLAMKLHASRDERDLDDAASLFTRLGYTVAEQAIALLSHTYPPGQLLPRHYYIAEDVARRAAQRGIDPEAPESPEASADRLRRSIEHENRQGPGSRRARLSSPDASTSQRIEPPPASQPPEPPGIGFYPPLHRRAHRSPVTHLRDARVSARRRNGPADWEVLRTYLPGSPFSDRSESVVSVMVSDLVGAETEPMSTAEPS